MSAYKKQIAIFFSLFIFIPAVSFGFPTYYEELQCDEFSTQQAKYFFDNKSKLFVDCRSFEEYRKGHIPNALWLQTNSGENDILKNLPIDTPIIIYCRTQNRSRLMGARLNALGYSDISIMFGGWAEWVRLGYPNSNNIF
jgi:rhodanese-related sulfurtransferase